MKTKTVKATIKRPWKLPEERSVKVDIYYKYMYSLDDVTDALIGAAAFTKPRTDRDPLILWRMVVIHEEKSEPEIITAARKAALKEFGDGKPNEFLVVANVWTVKETLRRDRTYLKIDFPNAFWEWYGQISRAVQTGNAGADSEAPARLDRTA